MSTFPPSPSPGEETADGRYFYDSVSGTWKSTSGVLDPDLVALAAANNSDVLVETDWPYTTERESDIADAKEELVTVNSTLDDVAPPVRRARPQVIDYAVSGNVPIVLSDGLFIHVPETAGTWKPDFREVPVEGVTVWISVNVSANGHVMDISDIGAWKQGTTAPVTDDWDIGEQMVFRATKMPFIEPWIFEWMYNGVTPPTEPDPITPPTLTATYSTSNLHTSPTTLEGATLPNAPVSIRFGPNSPDVESFDIFCNHVGALPAVGEEGDSYVGSVSTAPYDMLGTVEGVAVMWDQTDPTGNNRVDFDRNGETTFPIRAHLIDGQTVEETFTFNTGIAPLSGTDPVRSRQVYAFNGGGSQATVTIPDGVDRLVVVSAWYGNGVGNVMTGLTLGGEAMTKLTAACRDITPSTGIGVYTAYLTEADIGTGEVSLAPTYTTAIGSFSCIIYQVDVISNVASTALGGSFTFSNTDVATLPVTLAAVPANSLVLSGCIQQDPTDASMTCDVGVLDAETELLVNPQLELRTTYLDDSGVLGDETLTWTATGRQLCNAVYIDYEASGGGSGETPIIPAVPVLNTPTLPADNQARFTWPAAADAVTYDYRWGLANPPLTTVTTGNTSRDVTITGLAASVPIYFQARSVSSTDDRSAWSTVATATPTGSVTPPPTPTSKFLTADNAFDAAYSQGNGPMQFSDVWIPTTIRRYNSSQTEQAQANMANDTFMDDPISRYLNRKGGNNTAFITEMGPRVIWTMRLAPLAPRNHSKGTALQAAQGVWDMGITGSKGTLNRDWVWNQLGTNMNRVYRGFDIRDILFLSIAHETNGPWSSAYMGRDTKLIGSTLLLGATNAQFGSEMGAALRKAGETGEIADVHRLACERVWDLVQAKCNGQAIIGMTPADGGSSTPEDTLPANLSTDWVYDAFPNRDLDFICPTVYARGHGIMIYDGTGSIDDKTNWSFRPGLPDHALEYINDRYGCAGGFLETGAAYALPTTTVNVSGNNSVPDEGVRAFMELLHDDWTPAAFPGGVAFQNHWTVLSWAAAANPGTGCSFHILEGMWGDWPDGTAPTSTSKPAHSTVTVGSQRYTKTLDWFRDRF